jgi:flavin reductase (DIM6/NTAB) family NADH-FMN oxidoreductase RutF
MRDESVGSKASTRTHSQSATKELKASRLRVIFRTRDCDWASVGFESKDRSVSRYANWQEKTRLTPAHMTLVPSEAISALRALECPMQLEARYERGMNKKAHERTVPLDKSLTFELNVLRVHLDSSVVLGDVHPNMWTPLMTCLREAYRTSPAN